LPAENVLPARLPCAGIIVAVAPVSAKNAIIAAIATAPAIIILLLCYTDGLQLAFIILYGLAIMRFEFEKKENKEKKRKGGRGCNPRGLTPTPRSTWSLSLTVAQG